MSENRYLQDITVCKNYISTRYCTKSQLPSKITSLNASLKILDAESKFHRAAILEPVLLYCVFSYINGENSECDFR